MHDVEEGCATLVTTDAIDRQILAILRRDGRAAVSDIARAVGLSSAPVSRRIERMERAGVIRGYTALIDDQRSGSLEAFTEVRLAGGIETGELGEIVRDVPEVQEFFTIAGDPDALVRMRVDDVDHLQRVVNALRRTGKLTGTKTLIVMHTWNRAHDPS
jgi:Lrp/AsnC family leucine-responsive transcriptional regulator